MSSPAPLFSPPLLISDVLTCSTILPSSANLRCPHLLHYSHQFNDPHLPNVPWMSHLLWTAVEDAVQDEVGPEKWPLALNVLKQLQLWGLIGQPAGVLKGRHRPFRAALTQWDMYTLRQTHSCNMLNKESHIYLVLNIGTKKYSSSLHDYYWMTSAISRHLTTHYKIWENEIKFFTRVALQEQQQKHRVVHSLHAKWNMSTKMQLQTTAHCDHSSWNWYFIITLQITRLSHWTHLLHV